MIMKKTLRDCFKSCKGLSVNSLKKGVTYSTYRIVKPGKVSPIRNVPDHIIKPSYAVTGEVPDVCQEIEIKTEQQIQSIREACKLARQILVKAGEGLRVGMTTDKIDRLVHEEMVQNNAYPSPLLYKNFPKSVCTSVNNVICHGIPDDVPLVNGDILNIDLTAYLNGYHGDTSATFSVGEVDHETRNLMQIGETCLQLGISVCKPGAQFCDIGDIIYEYASSQGCSVVPEFMGHGIGSYFHGPPHIFHVPFHFHRDIQSLQTMRPGMVFTIEPLISEGCEDFEILSDGWTAISLDNSRSVQYEHTVLITQQGVEILTA